jgi:hypothetical protein
MTKVFVFLSLSWKLSAAFERIYFSFLAILKISQICSRKFYVTRRPRRRLSVLDTGSPNFHTLRQTGPPRNSEATHIQQAPVSMAQEQGIFGPRINESLNFRTNTADSSDRKDIFTLGGESDIYLHLQNYATSLVSPMLS